MLDNLNDEIEERGYISKDNILQYVSEEEIYELVFGFKPQEYNYVTSPFRTDITPGCWFERYNGVLRFKDFGNPMIIKGIKMRNIDCFDAIKVYYNLSNMYQVLVFIKNRLIEGKPLKKRPMKIVGIIKKKENKKDILIRPRRFDERDKEFWSKYEISKANLIEDKVFPLVSYKILNTKNGDVIYVNPKDICYAYMDFNSGNKKIYRPKQKGKKRFLTTCHNNDIGHINSLINFGKQLIITKSYKDSRVLKNQGLNSVWFQSEGTRPGIKELFNLCKRFEEVIIFYDNDKTGMSAAQKLSNEINILIPGRSRSLWLPVELQLENISDPSDLLYIKGQQSLIDFLIQNNLK